MHAADLVRRVGPDRNWEREVYARGQQLNRWPFSNLVSAVLRQTEAGRRRATRIIELGCGAGNNLVFLAREGFDTFGIDGSETAITVARQRLADEGLEARLIVGYLQALPYPDCSFDIILDRAAVTHNDAATMAAICREARRVLRPGGLFMLFDLFGPRHPDRLNREELSPDFYERRAGPGLIADERTSFLAQADIAALLSSYSNVQINRILVDTGAGQIVSESFDVIARK